MIVIIIGNIINIKTKDCWTCRCKPNAHDTVFVKIKAVVKHEVNLSLLNAVCWCFNKLMRVLLSAQLIAPTLIRTEVTITLIHLHTQLSRCLKTVSRHGRMSWRHMWVSLRHWRMSSRHMECLSDISITFSRHYKTSPMSWRHFRSEWGGMSQDICFSILQCLELKCLEMFCRCLWRTICPILVYAINVWLTMNLIVVFQLISWFVTSSCEPMVVDDLETQRFRTFKLLYCRVS